MKRGLFLVLVLGMFQGTLLGATAESWEIEQFTPGDVSLQTQPDKAGRYIYGPAYATGLPNLEDTLSMPFDDTANLPEGFLVKRFPSRYAELGWTLNVPAGKYCIGLQIRCDSGGDPLFAGKGTSGSGGDPVVYLNERRIIFSTMTAPVELIPGQMAAELQSRDAMDVKPGDRIRIADVVEINNAFVVNLFLYTKPPVRGPILCGVPYDETTFYQSWGAQLNVDAPSASNPFAKAKYTILNVANRPLKLSVKIRAIDYYQKQIASEEKDIELEDLKSFDGEINFQTGSAPHYRVDLEVKDKETGRQTASYGFVRSNLTDSVRRELLLTGRWEAVGIPRTIELGDPPGEDAVWKQVSVPGQLFRYNWNPLVTEEWVPGTVMDTHVAWMRKVFDAPEWLAGKRYELWFSKVGFETHLYVNGKKIGEHFGDADSFSFDVTDAIKPGEKNEILLGIRDGIIAAAAPEAVRNADLSFPVLPARWIAPCDIMTGGSAAALTGIGGDVWLRAMPAVFVEDVFIIPSVRNKTLTLDITVHNNTGEFAKALVSPSVWEYGKKAFDISAQTIEVPAGKSTKVTLTHPWENPHLWEQKDPHLYELRVSLGQGGDCWRDRFGFREFWAKDNLYYLNGKIARLWRIGSYIDGFEKYSWGKLFADLKNGVYGPGCYMVRLRAPENGGITLADEAGMLTHAGVNRTMGASEYILASEEFWANCKRITSSSTRTFRNHPSLVMYEGGNEFWCFSGYANMPSANDVAGQRLAAIGKVIREIDPTRPVTFDADADLGGLWDTIDLHYSMGLGNPLDPTTGDYLPDSAYHRSFDKPFKKGEPVRMCTNGKWITRPWGEKPISLGETGEFFLYLPFDATLIGGDKVYRGYDYTRSRYIAMLDRFWFDGSRDLDSTMIHPWENWGAHGTRQISFPPVCANVLNTEGHYRAGEKITKYINIHHDVWDDENLKFRWSLSDRERRYLVEEEVMGLSSGQLVRKTLTLKAPETTSRLDLTFKVELIREGNPVYSHDYPMVIYPARKPGLNVPTNTVIYDPSGKTLQALKEMGGVISAISKPNSAGLKNVRVLLIGRDSVDETLTDCSRDILRFVEAGGRVISFEQSSELQWLPIPIQPDQPRRQSYTFIRVPDHPVLKGLVETDLQLWQNDRLVARKEFRKPNIGSYLPLVDSGGKPGLEWTSLVEIYHGKGSYLLSQLLVTERALVEPVAEHLLRNILTYASLPLYRQRQSVALVGKPEGNLARTVQNLRFQIDLLATDKMAEIAKYRAIIIDGQENISASTVSELIAFARDGGTVVLHDLTPETGLVWRDAMGLTFSVRQAKAVRSTGHVMLIDSNPILSGVSGHELYWHTSEHVDSSGDFFQKTVFDKLFEYECAIDPEKSETLTFPSVIVVIPVDKGKVLIDQLRWDKANTKSQGLANRLGSWLLTNLGASFRPAPPIRKLSGGLSYRSIDLSQFANRSLDDEVAGDGKGGWSDQGNNVDLRDFPTGKVTLKGIPYLIPTPKSCIVLNQKGAVTEVKEVPVNGKAEALYFLHSGAWISNGVHAATYVITYADGEKVEIPLIGEKNIRDWASSKPNAAFSGEEPGIKTILVWTGSNTAWPITSVYSMEWINPEPDRYVKSIDFIGTVKQPMFWTEGQPVPILMGLTVAEPGEKK